MAGKTITADKLSEIVGMNERWLRKLAARGHIPSPIRGVYQERPAFIGLLKYQRDQLNTKSRDFQQERTALTAAKKELAQIEVEKQRAKLVDVEDISNWIRNIFLNQRATLRRKFEQELANNLMGLTDVERREKIKSAVDEYLAIMYENAKQWIDSAPENG